LCRPLCSRAADGSVWDGPRRHASVCGGAPPAGTPPLTAGLPDRVAQSLKDQEAIAAELAAAEAHISATPRGLALLRRCAGGRAQCVHCRRAFEMAARTGMSCGLMRVV